MVRHGRLEPGDAALVLKVSPVTARKMLNDLVRQGFLVSDSPKTPVRLAFPLDYHEWLLPQLFTDAPVASSGFPALREWLRPQQLPAQDNGFEPIDLPGQMAGIGIRHSLQRDLLGDEGIKLRA